MLRAYVLIEASIRRSPEIASSLRKTEGVVSVDVVTGPYDVIAVIEAEDQSAIGKLVLEKIHAIPGVVRTVTCLAIRLS